MSEQDPISNMLISIKNGQISKKSKIKVFFSNLKLSICKVLKNEGYILNYNKILIRKNIYMLYIYLKYFKNKPVIEYIKKISKPSLRIYKGYKYLPKLINGIGIIIVSNSCGVMTSIESMRKGIGGEIICYVY